MSEKRYWLMKSEGDCYSIDHLKNDGVTPWEGVRNYQARNFMMRDMRKGDFVLFYHSNDKPSGVYGIGKIASAAHPDESQFDKKHMHFDPKSTRAEPIWYCIDVAFVLKAKHALSLALIKADPHLEGMLVRAKASRLSVQPVIERHFVYIKKALA